MKSLINEPNKTVTKEKLRSLFKNFNPLNLDIKRIIDNEEEKYEKFVGFILKGDHKIFEALA